VNETGDSQTDRHALDALDVERDQFKLEIDSHGQNELWKLNCDQCSGFEACSKLYNDSHTDKKCSRLGTSINGPILKPCSKLGIQGQKDRKGVL